MKKSGLLVLLGGLLVLGARPAAAQVAPARAARRASADPWQTGFLALPYLGFHAYDDFDELVDHDAGLRLGTLLGWRVAPLFSLNGELTVDPSHIDSPAGTDIGETALDLAASPLVHFPLGMGELVLGPKVGYFRMWRDLSALGQSAESSWSGFVAGLNLGFFVPVSREVALGGLAAFVLRNPLRACVELGDTEVCQDDVEIDAPKVLSLAFGAMF